MSEMLLKFLLIYVNFVDQWLFKGLKVELGD